MISEIGLSDKAWFYVSPETFSRIFVRQVNIQKFKDTLPRDVKWSIDCNELHFLSNCNDNWTLNQYDLTIKTQSMHWNKFINKRYVETSLKDLLPKGYP